jgi:hypothetical protein
MAFPDVAATNNNDTAAADGGTTHAINVPAGTASGQRLVAIVEFDDGVTISGLPSGWAELAGGSSRLHVIWKDLTAAESNFSITSSAATWGGAICASITGHDTATAPAVGTRANASTNPVTFNSLDPAGWATEDTLWMALYGWGDSNRTCGFPTNCPNDRVTSPTGTSSKGRAQMATAESATSSFDPTDCTLSSGHLWETLVVAIRPAPAPSGFKGAGIPVK